MPTYATRDSGRFGIGEWYGRLIHRLSPDERRTYAELQYPRASKESAPTCPFRSSPDLLKPCNKKGGVCSIRRYIRVGATGEVMLDTSSAGGLRTMCPERFRQGGLAYSWVGEELLRCTHPIVLNEIKFLIPVTADNAEGEAGDERDVGSIDQVLVVPESEPLSWCALEVQAVYFSGSGMSSEFRAMRDSDDASLPFPVGQRRPDYRSSGPKRLMPQLQIKVPALRRWGQKMAVVVDRDFFNQLAPMEHVRDVSNCDIAWFVLDFEEEVGDQAVLKAGDLYLTTLERAVEGLTAGVPVSKVAFEAHIRTKLEHSHDAS